MSTQIGRPRYDRAAFLEDVEFLVSVGTQPDLIAERLGLSRQTMVRRLQREGRHDLAARMATS